MIFVLIIMQIFCVSAVIGKPQIDKRGNKSESNIYNAQIGFHANIYHDLYLLKNSVKIIDDKINNFDELYNNKLNRKLITIFDAITNVEGNIKTIQDKAHMWDVFQHHISAWNEQIKSLDKKVDIISSGQEKMLLFDGKLGFLLNLEYNSQRIINKLSTVEDRLDAIEKKINKETKGPTIFDEFATRGVLSTLKTLESKYEKSNLLLNQLVLNVKDKNESSESIEKSKYVLTCPSTMEELVKDMSSKVDLVYDKIMTDGSGDDEENSTTTEYSADNEYSEYYQSDAENLEKPIIFTKNDKKSIRKILKHLICPSSRKLESVFNEIYINRQFMKNISELLITYKESSERVQTDSDELLIMNFKKYIDSKNKEITFILNKFQTPSVILNDLKIYFDAILKNVIKICQKKNNIDDQRAFSTVTYISDDSSSLDNENESSHINILDDVTDSYSSSIEEHTFHSTESYFESTTLNTNIIDENELSSIDDVYFTNVADLSNNIINRSSLANDSIDICQNPGSIRYCDDEGFITIQSRVNKNENFTRSWDDYKWGFGSLDDGNFWIGNEAIYCLTQNKNNYSFATLKIELEDYDGNRVLAQYNNFKIDSEKYFYKLSIGEYLGNASDSLSYHNNANFSTFDNSNDEAPSCCPCSKSYGGGWWFRSCFESNLNGIFYDKPTEDDYRGIIWEHWSGETSLAKTKMSVKITYNWKNRKISIDDP